MHIVVGIVVIAAIYILYLLITRIIAPLASILFPATIIVGAIYAFYISIDSFLKSLSNHINPYTTYTDKNPNAPIDIKRNYFFGPGYHQITVTVEDAFSNLKTHLEKLADFKDKNTGYNRKWFIKMWVWIFYFAACLFAYVLGFAWMIVFSIALSSIVFVGMCIFYFFFTLLWIADISTLTIKSIQSRCGSCKRLSIVPMFICPDCGGEHKKLTPGAYGILKRKCNCNQKLPTTFFNGRSKLKASCPFCASGLAASDARQFGIQLVGGVSAGKTTFLAAFWHEYIECLKTLNNLTYEKFPADAFEELENWYQKGLSSSTTQKNANMYSIVHKQEKEIPHQLTVYDIAGEAFTELSNDIQQQQFRYCEGLIFVIDPTAVPSAVNETFSSFINEFKVLKGKHSTKVSDIPSAVVVSKADLFKREIGLLKIKSRKNEFYSAQGQGDSVLIRVAGNEICKEFLKNHGFENVLNLIDGEFNNAQYFPVSAMGHIAALGQPYEPWGIMEPVKWILNYSGGLFKDILKHI